MTMMRADLMFCTTSFVYFPAATFLLVLQVDRFIILCLQELSNSVMKFKLHRPGLKQIRLIQLNPTQK